MGFFFFSPFLKKVMKGFLDFSFFVPQHVPVLVKSARTFGFSPFVMAYAAVCLSFLLEPSLGSLGARGMTPQAVPFSWLFHNGLQDAIVSLFT